MKYEWVGCFQRQNFHFVFRSTFNMSEDTQVIMSETTNGLYAFVSLLEV